ncbi:hypothetical protein LS68_009240 [Helicobacter sp. MIT 05-5293]|uniref:hypothetical protein n=1 Tax=unclassified Helicobacter TaxID=2593540 RepID=UPI00051D1BBD|nr:MULTISPECIES: hypothetical protein [unclassified Helicobacter]TLD79845.1 hypothetical protein LS68_009240 [Helicobacter sp. MIT 05-5293]TLD85427.1 hypothetical protein LS69_009620 [Helicobacter sp. MIT 05-5294]
MKAKPNTKYALINGAHIISEIFDSSVYKEWDERSIKTIELNKEQEEYAFIGMQVNHNYTLPPFDIASKKEQILAHITYCLESELYVLREGKTPAEIETYQEQAKDAQRFLDTHNEQDAPFLKQLADARNIPLEELAQKVLTKSASYNTAYAKLLGHYQQLKEKIENATTLKELQAISYKSPLGE